MNPTAAMTPAPYTLPAEMTVYTVAELRGPLLAWAGARALSEAEVWLLDAAGVEEVDTAGVQLLLALARSAELAAAALRLQHPSPALLAACQALGVDVPLSNTAATRPEERSA